MLNKEICKQCMNEWFRHEKVVDNKDWNRWAKWGKREDKNWEHGFIICFGKADVGHMGHGPQLECRMRLEQMLVNDEAE